LVLSLIRQLSRSSLEGILGRAACQPDVGSDGLGGFDDLGFTNIDGFDDLGDFFLEDEEQKNEEKNEEKEEIQDVHQAVPNFDSKRRRVEGTPSDAPQAVEGTPSEGTPSQSPDERLTAAANVAGAGAAGPESGSLKLDLSAEMDASVEAVTDFMTGSGPGNLEKDCAVFTGGAIGAKASNSHEQSESKPKKKRTFCSNAKCAKALTGKPLRCSACKGPHYCDIACQKAHWKNGHKADCLQRQAELQADASRAAESRDTAGSADNRIRSPSDWVDEFAYMQQLKDVDVTQEDIARGFSSLEALLQTIDQAPVPSDDGASAAQLMSVCEWAYEKDRVVAEKKPEECGVCLDVIEAYDKKAKLPCGHMLHSTCVTNLRQGYCDDDEDDDDDNDDADTNKYGEEATNKGWGRILGNLRALHPSLPIPCHDESNFAPIPCPMCRVPLARDPTEQMITSYEQMITAYEHVELAMKLTNKSMRQRLCAAASLAVQTVLREDPDNEEAHWLLAQVLVAAGNKNAVVAAKIRIDKKFGKKRKPEFQKMADDDPESPHAHWHLGRKLMNMGKIDASFKSLERAIALDPKYVDAHCTLGDALRQKGELDKAISSYKRAVSIDSTHKYARNRLESALRRSHGLASANQPVAAEPVLPHRGDNVPSTSNQPPQGDRGSNAHSKPLEDADNSPLADAANYEAISSLEEAIAPDMPVSWLIRAHVYLGQLLRRVGKCRKAISSWRVVTALEPRWAAESSRPWSDEFGWGQWFHHYMLVLDLREIGNIGPLMAKSCKKIIALSPDLQLKSLGNIDASLRFRGCKSVLGHVHYMLGVELENMDNTKGATSSFRRAIALDPMFFLAHCSLADALEAQGMYDEAATAYQDLQKAAAPYQNRSICEFVRKSLKRISGAKKMEAD
jgi:tetratricopeptide (TPR) repeat protein